MSPRPALLERPAAAPRRSERDRVVAELQAIVVGALGEIGVHASLARTHLGVDDERARQRVVAISDLALGTLEELRRLLDALADDRLSDGDRASIARDVHDSVGHGVSLAGVLAGAAQALMDRDREAARRSLEQLHATVEETARELRALLAPLDLGAAVPAGDAQEPGDVRALVERAAAAGQPVRLELRGAPLEATGPGLRASLHRVVQEALTNACRHAPGSAVDVRVDVRADAIDVDIRNGAAVRARRTGGCGRGIAGMRERARLLGGGLHAGPQPDGGFRVHARLPR